MPTFVAIDISNSEATLVTGEPLPGGRISILGLTKTGISAHSASNGNEGAAVESGADSTLQASETFQSVPLEELLQREVDGSLAILPAQSVLFEYLSLPFQDEKRLNQIVPLQVQDLVPFEIQDFVVDSFVAGKKLDGEYRILSSLTPQAQVSETLAALSGLGADPKLLTSKASAATALIQLFPEECTGNFVFVIFTRHECSLAIFVNAELFLLREFSFSSGEADEVSLSKRYQEAFQEIRCSIIRVELEQEVRISKHYMIGSPESVREMTRFSGQQFSALDLSRVVQTKTQVRPPSETTSTEEASDIDVNQIAWAVGLFVHEFSGRKSKSKLLDFRKGHFSYNPSWGNLRAALTEEREWIGIGLFWLVAWFLTVVYTTTQTVAKIDDAIANQTGRYLPGTKLTYLREASSLEDKISELKEQLQGLGTLATLSPLESLKEITTTIPQDLDIGIDTVTVGHFGSDQSGVSFTGTVANYPSVGRISDAFEKHSDHFCNVKVEPKGRSGSGRIKFSAEISFCD